MRREGSRRVGRFGAGDRRPGPPRPPDIAAKRRMVAKLAVIIISIGAAFGALLVNRQQRIDAVAEIARAQLRMEMHDKTIMRLQAAVAKSIRPDELRAIAFAQPVEWQQIPYRFDPFHSPTGTDRAVAGAIQPPSKDPLLEKRGKARSNKPAASNGSRSAMPERKRTPQRVAADRDRRGER